MPMLNATLIKLEMGRECFDIYPYCRKYQNRRCFCFIRENFGNWLKGPDNSTFYDKHIYSTLTARKRGDNVFFQIMWLDSIGDEKFLGYEQDFSIPIQVMQEFLQCGEGESMRYLWVQRMKSMRIITTNVSEVIVKIRKNHKVKRAFIKAISKWNWSGDTITLYRDGMPLSFFFRSDGYPSCGGLILHESRQEGKPPRCCYQVHT